MAPKPAFLMAGLPQAELPANALACPALLQRSSLLPTSPPYQTERNAKMSGKFEPKTPVQLNPPKSDPISLEELAKADGKQTKCPRAMASHAVAARATVTDR